MWLQTAQMRSAGHGGDRLVTSNFNTAYWTVAQIVTHHASNGCPLNPGDLLGTGTISGPERSGFGSLLEITKGGAEPVGLGLDADAQLLRARYGV